MRVDDSFPAIQFLMDGIEHLVAEKPVFDSCRLVLINGMHTDAVGFQDIQRILDFFQASIDIRQR